jgi:hypothetical protein
VLDKGQVAPGLHYTELAQRRQNLANLMPPGSLAVIPAASLAFVTGVIPYPYRQDADFLYLTGLQQQAVALIRSGGEGRGPEVDRALAAAAADTQLSWT